MTFQLIKMHVILALLLNTLLGTYFALVFGIAIAFESGQQQECSTKRKATLLQEQRSWTVEMPAGLGTRSILEKHSWHL